MNIVPIHPSELVAELEADSIEGVDVLGARRTLGRGFPSRRTFGRRPAPSRRTLGRGLPSRRTLGRGLPSRRTLMPRVRM